MPYQLDALDKRILGALTASPTASYAEIGKTAKCSKEVVNYRVKRLTEAGVIQGFVTIFWLGQSSYKILMQFEKTTAKREKEIISYLTSHKNISWVTPCIGSHDLIFTIMTKDNEEFDIILREVLEEIGDSMHDYKFAVSIQASTFGPRYAVELPKAIPSEKQKQWNLEFDDKDRIIADIIRNNARISITDICKQTKIPVETIKYRIKKMEANSVIRRYRMILNPLKLGFHRYEIFLRAANLSNEFTKKFKGFAAQKQCIEYFDKCVGAWDFEFTACFKSSEQLRGFILEMKELFGEHIKSMETVELFETYNYTYVL